MHRMGNSLEAARVRAAPRAFTRCGPTGYDESGPGIAHWTWSRRPCSCLTVGASSRRALAFLLVGALRGQIRCAPWKGVDLQWVQFPPGNWVAPAGSYRSGGGGNKTVGAFETDGPHGGSASRQAVT